MIKLDAHGYATSIVVPQAGTEAFYIAEGYRDDIPAPLNMTEYRWDDGWWMYAPHVAEVDLGKARTDKSREVDKACKATILAGFESSALGAAYHYPTKMTDQQNLASSILDSLLPDLPDGWTTPFWCADVAGEWAFRPHTAMHIQQVGRDAKQAILAAMARNEQLQAQITAATTFEELEAISW